MLVKIERAGIGHRVLDSKEWALIFTESAPLHCGEEIIFCPIKCCCENLLGIRDPVSTKMSVSECVQ